MRSVKSEERRVRRNRERGEKHTASRAILQSGVDAVEGREECST